MPPPPTILDKINYQRIRSWFLEHETEFVSPWKQFCESREEAPGDEDLARVSDGGECPENLFAVYYSPENLYHLMWQFNVLDKVDTWAPDEHRVWEVSMTLLQVGAIAAGFFDWVYDRVEED